MAISPGDVARFSGGISLGPARSQTATAVAKNNETAMRPGWYTLSVETGAVRVAGPGADTLTADGNTDKLLMAGDDWDFFCGSAASEQFVSVIRDAADSTFTVAGIEPSTAAVQPPDWT